MVGRECGRAGEWRKCGRGGERVWPYCGELKECDRAGERERAKREPFADERIVRAEQRVCESETWSSTSTNET